MDAVRWGARVMCALAIVGVLASGSRAQDADTAKASAHFDQGEAYWKVGAYDQAVAEYEAAYALVPKPGFLFNIGLCYEALGDKPRALEYFRRYLSDSPDGRRATEARARAVQLERDIAKAADAEAAAREREEQAAVRATAIAAKVAEAESAAGAGDYDTALAAYRAAHELSGDVELLFAIGATYDDAGKSTEAIAHYETYLAQAPAGPSSVEARRRLQLARERVAAAAAAAPPAVVSRAAPPRKPARWGIGVKGGPNFSKAGFFTADDGTDDCNTPAFVSAGMVGASLTFAVNDRFGLQSEVLVFQKALSVECEGMPFFELTQLSVYLEVPVFARVTATGGAGTVAAYAGPLLDVPIAARDAEQPGIDFEDHGAAFGFAIGVELALWVGPGQLTVEARAEGTTQSYRASGTGFTFERDSEASLALLAGYAFR
jgi:tetratricopeptide (TPR) repeat protein